MASSKSKCHAARLLGFTPKHILPPKRSEALSWIPSSDFTMKPGSSSKFAFFALIPVDDDDFGTRFAYREVLDPHIIGDRYGHGICPQCGSGLGMLPWLPPQRITLTKAVYPDILWGEGSGPMFSDRALECYDEAALTGLTRIDPPAEIVRVGRRAFAPQSPPPNYHYVWYRYDGGDLDDTESGAVRKRVECRFCRQEIHSFDRIVLREGSWTGLDIFEAFGLPGTILVSERFKEAFDLCRLTGADLIPANDYSINFSLYPSSNIRRRLKRSE